MYSLYHCQIYQFLSTVVSLDLCKCCKSAQISNVQVDSKIFKMYVYLLVSDWYNNLEDAFFSLQASNLFSSAYTSVPEKCSCLGKINLFQPSVTNHKTSRGLEGKWSRRERGEGCMSEEVEQKS